MSQTTNVENLQEKMQDLILKYEALDQKYKTTTLENNEYLKRIAELEEQTQYLTNALQSTQNQVNNKKLFGLRFDEMSEDLDNNTTEIKTLKQQIKSYVTENYNLKSENAVLQKNNHKLQAGLEINNKQKEIQRLLLITANRKSNKHINSLKSEIQQLRDELSAVKNVIITPKTPNLLPESVSPQSVRALRFGKTPNLCAIGANPYQLAAIVGSPNSVRGHSLFGSIRNVYAIEDGTRSSNTCTPSETMLLQTPDVRERENVCLEEFDETVLMNDICEKVGCICGDECDGDDLREMESLFAKCDKETQHSPIDYRKKVMEWWKAYSSLFTEIGAKCNV